MNKPAVSVVIPCYNLGAYLDQTVQSVLDQTYDDFEILIIDDGSTDPATRHLFVSYQRPKTRIIRTKNSGLAEARNLGIREAKGDYVSCLDADDLFESTFLQRTVERLDADRSLAYASCWLKAFGEAQFEWTPNTCEFPQLLAEETVCIAALTRRQALLEVGGFDPHIPVTGYEDWDLAISLVERGLHGVIIPEYLFRYRMRPGSMSGSCIEPSNHALLMRYIVEKHAETYRKNLPGVLETIEKRTVEMEGYRCLQLLPENPRQRERISFLEDNLHGVLESRNWKFSLPLRLGLSQLKSLQRKLSRGKSKTPRLSVVVTCCDQGMELTAALESVCRQIGAEDEIIIVDDGSRDPITRQRMQWYEEAGFKLVRTRGVGLTSAREVGLRQAKSSFVFAMDADQTVEAGYIQRALEILEVDSGLTFVCCGLRDQTTGYTWLPESAELPELLSCPRSAFPILRRERLSRIGGYDTSLTTPEQADWELMIRLVAKGQKGLLLHEPLVNKGTPRPVMRAVEGQHDRCQSPVREVVEKHPHLFESHWKEAILGQENRRRRLQASIEGTKSQSSISFNNVTPVDWGGLRRLEPISPAWGTDRGQPIDRYYIEQFLDKNHEHITGCVLEVKDPWYTKTYGERIERSDVVDIAQDNPSATLVRDLAAKGSLPETTYDCFILTQTIHIIYDIREVLENAARTLRPGGVLLATLPCVSRLDYESGLKGDYWRFTPAAAKRLFEESFGAGQVEVRPFGNVLICCGFLMGLSAGELTTEELDYVDPYFPLLVCIKATKAGRTVEVSKPLAATAQPASGSQSGLVASPRSSHSRVSANESFRVIAIMAAFNEGDIISPVIGHLVENGVDVYLIDNHSTDDTVKQARNWLGRGVLHIETFPEHPQPGSPDRFDWTAILRRKEELARELQADWFIHHDADEVREGPFPNLNLKDAIRWVDSLGYNCVDFRVFNFPPIDDGFECGADPREYFTFYESGADFDTLQLKCWKSGVAPVSLIDLGGHEVGFEGRRVFPIKFLLRHYPIRGQKHGRKKVFAERKYRFVQAERSKGWHLQYDSINDETHNFLRDAGGLYPFNLNQVRLELILRQTLDRKNNN